jgi:RNA polymerase sigma-70 factor (ECF subfamily)
MLPAGSHANLNDSTPGVFLTTRWSLVVRAGDDDEKTAAKALADLCRDYWRPLYHFARRKGQSAEDAQDLTQGFIAKLLESGSFSRADREVGRFRTFLISSFMNYMSNQHRDQTTQKRGGDLRMTSLDDPDLEAGYAAHDRMTPERLYERSWALALLERVMLRLREEYEKAGRMRLWDAIEPQLTGGSTRPGYAKMAAELGMSESALTVSVYRMRKRYGTLLREEIAATVTDAAEVEDELRHLMVIVSGVGDAV